MGADDSATDRLFRAILGADLEESEHSPHVLIFIDLEIAATGDLAGAVGACVEGPYPDVLSAMTAAVVHDEELTAADGEAGYLTVVVPLIDGLDVP